MNEFSTRLESLLNAAGIATKRVECYGRQIVVTLFSEDMADRVAMILSNAFRVKGALATTEDAKENRETVLRPTQVRIWRVYATTL